MIFFYGFVAGLAAMAATIGAIEWLRYHDEECDTEWQRY